jgi:hypothetical protein
MRIVQLLDVEALRGFDEYQEMRSFISAERKAMLKALAEPASGKSKKPKVAARRKPVRRASQ